MSNKNWMENSEVTAGLTSALQLINTTNAISFTSDTSDVSLIPLKILPALTEEHFQSLQTPKPYISRRKKFRKALEESINRNREILEELAKY